MARTNFVWFSIGVCRAGCTKKSDGVKSAEFLHWLKRCISQFFFLFFRNLCSTELVIVLDLVLNCDISGLSHVNTSCCEYIYIYLFA